MPEHNFEQQARDMANGFEMEPKPEVWQNVRNAIQQPQRKRRFVLWWWLLPLGLLGGCLTFYILNETGNETQMAKMNAAHQTLINKKVIPSKQPTEIKAYTDKEISEADSISAILSSKNNNVHLKQSSAIKIINRTVDDKKESNVMPDENTASANKISETLEVISEQRHQENNTSSPTADDKRITLYDSTITSENHQPLLYKDSLNSTIANQDTTLSATSFKSDSSGSSKSPLINKSAPPGIKKLTSKIHWGFIVEGGIATRKSSVLSFAGSEKSNDRQPSFPNTSGTGSNVTGTPGSNGFYYSNNIQHGAAFGLGAALQKKVNRSIDVVADVAYHYQSFKVATTVYKDSLVLNNAFALLAGSYKATQAFHFASLFAGINWHFINAKHIQLGISAGADNLFLIAADQKLHNISSNSSLNYAVQLNGAARISDSAFTKSSFYQYQPSLFAGVLFTIKKGNQQLQLIPFARSSFRPFDKYNTNSNNHLFSGGLRAVYFFK